MSFSKRDYQKWVIELTNQEYGGDLALCLSNIDKHRAIVRGC
jgi:hypothetical protein